MPGCSLREVTLTGTHAGDWCGVAGRREVSHRGPILFGSGEKAAKLVAERIYFDNESVMQQIRGEQDPTAVPDFARLQQRSTAAS